MDEIKSKFRNLKIQIKKHNSSRDFKIPAMGYSEYFAKNLINNFNEQNEAITITDNVTTETEETQRPDEEIMEAIERVYFQENFNSELYQLEKLTNQENFAANEMVEVEDTVVIPDNIATASKESDACDETDKSPIDNTIISDNSENLNLIPIKCDIIEEQMLTLKQQQKVVSKKVLQLIVEKRSDCSHEFENIDVLQKELQESLWVCRKARSYLNYAKTNLTTTSLEVLAAYRKRELLKNLLNSLNVIKALKSTDLEVQKLLIDSDYKGALLLILECKEKAEKLEHFECVRSLNQKLQDTYILTEYQLDKCLQEMINNFNATKYENLQDAYKLLNKSLIAMDQLHINFISIIHSSVNKILHNYTPDNIDQKQLFEQQCDLVPVDKFILCLLDLCKEFWKILVSYYYILQWHQNHDIESSSEVDSNSNSYIKEKLHKGKFRLWSDMEAKICLYLQTAKNKKFKFDQFIQILSIVQRLTSVGKEFCGNEELTSTSKLIDTMLTQSEIFFHRYHISCLEEICLFLDNEAWTDVSSFSDILQLQEFRSIGYTIKHYTKIPSSESKSMKAISDELLSMSSKDDRSIYGTSSGYFLRFSEKSSPFDGGLDTNMIEEDILSGIIDQSSYYCSESGESGDEERKHCEEESKQTQDPILICSTALNILRVIGRYLQMCKLLHCISPTIINSMLDLIYFYVYAIYEIFSKDSLIPNEQVYTPILDEKLLYVSETVVPLVKMWPSLNFSSIKNNELLNPDTMHGLPLRVIALESGICMVEQFKQLIPYLKHLLPNGKDILKDSIETFNELFDNLLKPIYLCSTSRTIDLDQILGLMAKIKWDLNHVSVHHSNYVDVLNRNCQSFAMILEENSKIIKLPLETIWNNFAYVTTHLLVEGFSNAKKCSPAGRQLMQLDFANFMSIMELLSKKTFSEHRQYVDAYIKAFYFPIELFEEWILEQKKTIIYSVKQLVALVLLVCSSDKQKRQKLCEILQQNNIK